MADKMVTGRVVRWIAEVVSTEQRFETNLITDLSIPELYKAIAKFVRSNSFVFKKAFYPKPVLLGLIEEYGVKLTETSHQEQIVTYIYIGKETQGYYGFFDKRHYVLTLPMRREEILEDISYEFLCTHKVH